MAQMLFSYPNIVLQSFAGNTAYIPYGPIANGIPAIPYPERELRRRPAATRDLHDQPAAQARISAATFSPTTSPCRENCLRVSWDRLPYVGTHSADESVLFNINAANPGAGNGRAAVGTIGLPGG